MTGLPSVDDVRGDLPAVLARFRAGRTHAFSFGEREPEAVMLTYDEFEDLGGERKFSFDPTVLTPTTLADRLPTLVDPSHPATPVVWGTDPTTPEAVVVTTSQYRHLRGDDEPPPGVPDDPTRRTYATEPLPDSRPFNLDEIAALLGPEAVEELENLRREERGES
jgi:hypothetical protein